MNTNTMNIPVAIAADDTINAIVARYPQALATLQRFGLDACCGGSLPLQTAARRHGIELVEILAALRAEVEGNTR
jgi:regulator of cell morphogenesis and NO signaling